MGEALGSCSGEGPWGGGRGEPSPAGAAPTEDSAQDCLSGRRWQWLSPKACCPVREDMQGSAQLWGVSRDRTTRPR